MSAKPDALDRLVQLLLLVAAVTTIANGLFMLVQPLDGSVFVPTPLCRRRSRAPLAGNDRRRAVVDFARPAPHL